MLVYFFLFSLLHVIDKIMETPHKWNDMSKVHVIGLNGCFPYL